jgi:hypothetical protein
MSRTSHALIQRAIAQRAQMESQAILLQVVTKAYADGMIELAYAEGHITDAEHDEYRAQLAALGARQAVTP